MNILVASLLIVASVGAKPSPGIRKVVVQRRLDTFDRFLRSNAGSGARDCGVVEPRARNQIIEKCVENAISEKKPFFVRLNRVGIDSQIATGLSGDGSGAVRLFHYDNMVAAAERSVGVSADGPCKRPTWSLLPSGRVDLSCKDRPK